MLQGSGREPGTGSELLSSRQGELWGRVDPSEGGQTNRPTLIVWAVPVAVEKPGRHQQTHAFSSNLRGHGSTCSQPKHHASTT